jgi:hypothetical protein
MSFSTITRTSSAFAALALLSTLAPTTFAQSALEDAKLVAADGAASDTFGRAVAVHGTRAVVGAPLDNHNGKSSGSVYVFESNGSTWTQVAKLVSNDAANGDVFGTSVAIHGDRLVVGAEGDDDDGSSSGSAYVFVRNSSGVWVQEAKLLANDGLTFDEFGTSVAIEGSRVVVGAKGESDGGLSAGAVYVYERQTSGAWLQMAKILAPNASAGDQLGRSVGLSGDRIAAGAYGDDDVASDAGAAYVFKRNTNGSWSLDAKLTASDALDLDQGGWSVDIDGTRVVMGAYRADVGSNSDRGAAYVFERQTSGAWQQKSKLVASDGATNDRFGHAVAISGDFVIGGSYANAHAGFESGAAYLFQRNPNGTWSQANKVVASDAASVDQYGRYLALDGNTAFVGSFLDDDKGSGSGSAYALEVGTLLDTKPTVSVSQGGTQQLLLRAGQGFANSAYFFLGSASGEGAGIPLGGGVVLPLVNDGYLQWGLAAGLPITGSAGVLNGSGQALATYHVSPGSSSAFVGMTFHHAYIAVNPATGQLMASNAVAVKLVP